MFTNVCSIDKSFSLFFLSVSCDVYYKSLSNANQRKRKNTEVAHRTTCRRTGRMGAVSIEI